MVRITAAALGLAVGLVALGQSGPASAFHIRLEATGPDADAVVTRPVPPATPIVQIGEPMNLFGEVERADVGADRAFTHQFNFGVSLPEGLDQGPGGVSAIPNYLTIGGDFFAGFEEFEGVLTGPGLPTEGIELDRHGDTLIPRRQHLELNFAAIDTGGTTPYQLTITGELLADASVLIGNYTGNIAVIPLPGALILFLTALGGLAIFRYRRSGGEGAAA
jgi:hypothetical protein